MSANQGRVLDSRIVAIEAFGIPVNNEQPTVTPGDATVSLANTPVLNSEHVFLNGIRQCVGVGNDYTITGTTITFASARQANDNIVVDYHRV